MNLFRSLSQNTVMPRVRVKPGLLLTEKIGEVEIEGNTVGEILGEFERRFSRELEELELLEKGKLPPSFILLLNGRNVKLLEGERTRVKEGDLLMILPPAAGG
ncbi:MAG: molybdopterin synthase sulfur carrier subunit [Hadesarchaea archaeon]|nr:MAG: molybdopterin synthase sulfur carrier subunit [Hadesarchaea archaeon]TDA36418.1 MAG: molybdopterin synthase sulfur carrier subunit [Hadesarchaea archaeon]